MVILKAVQGRSHSRYRFLRGKLRQRHFLLVSLSLLALFASACGRSGKQKFSRSFATGLDYFGQEKYEAAAIEFRNAVLLEPRTWAPRYWLALSDLKLRRWQEAFQQLNVVVELYPSFASARLDLADLYMTGKKTHEAREQVDEVQRLNPQNVRAQTLLARIYLAEKDYPQAVKEFEKAKQLAPGDAYLWGACGLAKVTAKQPELAEKDFRRALELAPHSAEAYQNLANVLKVLKRESEAEQLLQTGVQSNPRSFEIYLTLADFYFRQKRVDDVEKLFGQMASRGADFPNLHLEQGEFWMWRNEVSRAANEFEAVLRQGPNLLVQRKLVSAYITLGRLDDAERLDQPILAKNPKDLEGRSFQGALRHLRGDSAGAVEELRAVLKEDPKSPFANYYLGLALIGAGKPDEAEAAFVDCVRYNERFVQAFQRLAELRLQKQDWDAGLEYAKKVVALMPQRPDGYLLAARAYLYKGDSQRTQQLLQGLQKMAPDSLEVQEYVGVADIRMGKIEAGVKQYQQAWAHSSAPLASLMRFADLLVASGKADVALRTLQQLIASEPRADYYKGLAQLQLVRDDPASAEAASQQALRLDSSSWLARFYLAEAYDQLHRTDEALANYDEVIRRQPKQIPPYILAGDVCLREGRFDRAKGYYEAARKQDPQSVLAEHGLARLWAEEGSHLDEAVAMVQGLQHKFPDDPFLSDTLAWVYYRKGQYPLALPLLKHCIEQQPKNALFHLHLGMAYAKGGELNLSRQELQSALRLGLDSARWETAAKEVLTHLQASG